MIRPHRDDRNSATPSESVPPLRHGDRLSRDEFERRYEAMPQVKKAELIDGVVSMPSPVRLRHHGQPHLDLGVWLGVYRASTPGLLGGDNATARLDATNEPQPDLMLLIDPDRGGQTLLGEDDYVEGAPELVAEVAASSATRDMQAKFEAYRRNGVKEYIVWRTDDEEIDWFSLQGDQFELLLPDDDALLRSRVFPGLWLDASALLRGELARVLAVLQQGLASPEHQAFVERVRIG